MRLFCKVVHWCKCFTHRCIDTEWKKMIKSTPQPFSRLKSKKKIFFARVKIFKNFFLDFRNAYHRDFFLTGSLSFELYNEKKIKSKFWAEPYKPGIVSKIISRKNYLFSKKFFSNFWNYFFKKKIFFIKFTCLKI